MRKTYSGILTQEFLISECVTNNKTDSQIADEIGCGTQTVSKYRRKRGIVGKSRSEIAHILQKNNFKVTTENVNYIDGLMLGDGYIAGYKYYSGEYLQEFSSERYPWAEKIQGDLKRFGITSIVRPTSSKKYYNGILRVYFGYRVRSKCYVELLRFRQRWYDSNGVKIVPRDINIANRQLLANWYLGDGGLAGKGLGPKSIVRFSTQCFSKEDVTFLRDELSEKLNIKAKLYLHKYSQKHILSLDKASSIKFLAYIKPFQVSCFKHKWYPEAYLKKLRAKLLDYDTAIRLHEKGYNSSEIGRQLNRGRGTIWGWVNKKFSPFAVLYREGLTEIFR